MPKKSVMELYLAGAGGNVQPRAKQELRQVTDTFSQPQEKRPPQFQLDEEDSWPQDAATASAYSEAHEERMREKMAMIDELGKHGTGRTFGAEDSMRSVELEFNRQRVEKEAESGVIFMKQMLKMGLQGIEMGNNRFGPWLQLDGFAEEASKDDEKYDAPLERIYLRIFRHGQMSPWVELAMLIGGSAFMCHMKNTMLNNAKKDDDDQKQGGKADELGARDDDDAKSTVSSSSSASAPPLPKRRGPARQADRPRKKMRRMSFKPQLATVEEDSEE